MGLVRDQLKWKPVKRQITHLPKSRSLLIDIVNKWPLERPEIISRPTREVIPAPRSNFAILPVSLLASELPDPPQQR
jgi:hypothetical protein